MTHAGYFEGIGGFSLGAERAGIETIYTCENDDYKHEWLQYYLPHAQHEKDIKTASGCYADIFTAGFPCQDTSIANPKGKGIKGERSGLFFEFYEHVRRFKPKYVVLENSPMLIYTKDLLSILRRFAIIGYDAEWQIISKRAFEYPDERERFILIAYSIEVGRKTNSRIFTRKYYKEAKQKIKDNEFVQHKLNRKSSSYDWSQFISGVLQNDTGIPKKLAGKKIGYYGDAICPDVAQLCFELIKIHYNDSK